MRTITLLGLILALFAFSAWAQESNPGKDASRAAADNGQQATMQGCLQSSGGRYSIRDDNGIVHLLRGDNKTLSRYVGHEVQVSGTRFTKAADTTMSGTASSAKEQPDLQVRDVKDIADTCGGR